MGKKSWFSAVKKAVSPSCSKVKKDERSHKSKSNPRKSWHGNQMSLLSCLSHTEATLANPPHYYPPMEEKELNRPDDEQIKHVDSIFYVTTVAEEAENKASQAGTEVKCMISSPRLLGKSMEEIGSIKIQKAYRGYLARRDFRALRTRRRLKLVIQGQAVKRQMASTLTSLRTMARVQSQVRARKIKMAEVNVAFQRQLLQRLEKELDKGSGFDLSPRSKEQVEASLRNKKEAAERREKALAYALSRQQTWRNSLKSSNSKFMDPTYLTWGWSWSERWNAVRPWEAGTTNDNEPVGRTGIRVSSPSKALSSVSSAKGSRKLVSSPAARSHKGGSTKSMNVGSRISKPGSSQLAGTGVGLAKKRHLVSDSPSSGGKRTLGDAPRKNSNTVRWNC